MRWGSGDPCPFQGLSQGSILPFLSTLCLYDHFFLFPHNLTRQLLLDCKGLVNIGVWVFPVTLFNPSQACQFMWGGSHISQPLNTSHSAWHTAGLRES